MKCPAKSLKVSVPARPKFVRQLADSIRLMGLLQPVQVNKKGEIKEGRYRYLALLALGWEEIPCMLIKS